MSDARAALLRRVEGDRERLVRFRQDPHLSAFDYLQRA